MRYRIEFEPAFGVRFGQEQVDVANLIYPYLEKWGHTRTEGEDWDLRVLIGSEDGRKSFDTTIFTPWTFRLWVVHPGYWDITWRGSGAVHVPRGTTSVQAGILWELEPFLRARDQFNQAVEDTGPARLDRSLQVEVDESLFPRAIDLPAEHVFVSYVREDSKVVDRLAKELTYSGVTVWLDRNNLGVGSFWRTGIRNAIQTGAFFVVCFSASSAKRTRTYMNEELAVAIDELRLRPRDRVWFLPVLLPGGEVPEIEIGGGSVLSDIQHIELAENNWRDGFNRLLRAIASRA